MPRACSGVLLATIILPTLLGCGQSGLAQPPAAPTLSVEAGLKRLRFSWAPVVGADRLRLLEDSHGASSYVPVGGDLMATATSYEIDTAVHLHDWERARYVIEACNAGGCSQSAPVSTASLQLDAIGSLSPMEGWGGQALALALSGDGLTLAGAGDLRVRVFARATSWVLQGRIDSPLNRQGAFGWDLSLSGDGGVLAVGDMAGDPSKGVGRAFVYERRADTWSQSALLSASNGSTFDYFGWSVALSADGNTLAIGAIREDGCATGIGGSQSDNRCQDSGAVYVFTRDTGGWTSQAYIKASNTDDVDHFGYSIALSADGQTLAVGAPGEDSAARGVDGDQASEAALSSGAVYVFSRTAASWHQEAYLKASNTETRDLFGGIETYGPGWDAVALSSDGNTLAVGAYLEDGAATGVGGDQASNGAEDSGAVYVFSRGASGWSQQAYVKASNTGSQDNFGWVALSGDGTLLAVGSRGEDSSARGLNGNHLDNNAPGAGAVYLFSRSGSTWSQLAYVKARDTVRGDEFGATALSEDGGTLAVGAPSHGVGAIYLY